MEPLNQLQREWVFINAARELLSIVSGVPTIRYSQSIYFAKAIDADLFKNSQTGIEKKDYFQKLFEKYEQEAKAKKLKSGKPFTAIKVIKNRNNEIKRLLKQYPKNDSQFDLLKKESKELTTLLTEEENLTSLGLERVTENQAINSDTFGHRARKVFVNNHLGKFSQYYNAESDSIFRITVLHPNPSEGVIGADLIYEQYDETAKKVRIVAVQYKVWDNGVFYFSQSDNLSSQLTKMHKSFCNNEFCKETTGGKNYSEHAYRMSYCMAFLKPTDKLQKPNKLMTTGYHVPICSIDKLKEKAGKDYKLTSNAIRKQSLKAAAFEELFDAEMLGSRWLELSDLEDFYKRNKVLDATERIVLYAQGTKRKHI